MKNVAKLAVGTVLLLYGVYGYLSGGIYEVPGKHDQHLKDIFINGDGLIFVALSYVAFGAILYVWAVPIRAEYTVKKKRTLQKYKQFSMFGLALLGMALQLVGALVDS